MNDIEKIKEVLTNLCSLPGPSGYEAPISEAVKEIWSELVDETSVSKLGNLYGLKKANAPISGKSRSVLFAAHMDAVGMIVTELVGEFIRFEEIGGLDPRVLPGQFVNIHTKQGQIKGLIVMPSRSLTKEDYGTNPIPLKDLLIETGCEADELKKLVRPGDVITFANLPVSMQDDTFSAHTLDNRASIAALTICLQELQTIRHKWNVYTVGTVQEEESLAGAKTAPFDLKPDIAVAIDVTHASSPLTKGWNTFTLGGGPVISYGMNMHPALSGMFKEICESERIPYAEEFSPRMSGTDAIAMQIVNQGIPTMVVSIPLRYMHTANELVSLKDIQNVGKLLAAFVRQLDENTMDRLVWED